MNVAELKPDEAFSKGADIWVLQNNDENPWWNEIDFRSGFLLSQCLFYTKKPAPLPLTEVLQFTEIQKLSFQEDDDFLVLGSSNHFFNKWIFLWNSPLDQTHDVIEKLEAMAAKLKTDSVRFFSDSKHLIKTLQARPKTSFNHITFVENT